MTVWQIASGDRGRDYAQLCIDHDVMIMGPGDPGDIRSEQSDYSSLNGRRRGMIRSFCRDIAAGDIVLLRQGHRLVAIGIVPDDGYAWDNRFDDVYGWDLQHSQRVCWQEDLTDELASLQAGGDLFGSRRLIATFSRVKDDSILGPVNSLIERCSIRELKDLPAEPGDDLSEDEVGESLFSHGLSQGSVDELLNAILRQRRLLQWYSKHGKKSDRPTEHEVVAYMVLPMLLSLGWSEQLLAVEWKKVDMAAFRRTPTQPEDCVLICEAKGMWDGLQGALSQAQGYAEKLRLRSCSRIVLTQGGRFYIYNRDPSGQWTSDPVGYFNVEKLRRQYVIPPETDAIDALMSLTPQRVLGDLPE